jgi:hypothetical protein
VQRKDVSGLAEDKLMVQPYRVFIGVIPGRRHVLPVKRVRTVLRRSRDRPPGA